jgi:hypothetical protein
LILLNRFVKKSLASDDVISSNNNIYNVQPVQSAAHKYREMRKSGQVDPLIGMENMEQNETNKNSNNNNNNNSTESSSTWTSTGFVLLAAVITAGIWKYLQQTPSQSDAAIINPHSADNTNIKASSISNSNEVLNIIPTATIIHNIDEIKDPIVVEINSNENYKQQPLWLQRKRATPKSENK